MEIFKNFPYHTKTLSSVDRLVVLFDRNGLNMLLNFLGNISACKMWQIFNFLLSS